MHPEGHIISAGGPCQQLWHGQGCPLFDVVHPAFPLPTTASPTLQGAVEDSDGEAVVACDMSEPCKFPSLDSGQRQPHFLVMLRLIVNAFERPCNTHVRFQHSGDGFEQYKRMI